MLTAKTAESTPIETYAPQLPADPACPSTSGACSHAGQRHPPRSRIVSPHGPKPPYAPRQRAANRAEATPSTSGSCGQVDQSPPKRFGTVRTRGTRPPQALRDRAATRAEAPLRVSGARSHVGRSPLGSPGSRGSACPHERKRNRGSRPACPHDTTCSGSRGQTYPHERKGSGSHGHACPRASPVLPNRSERIPQPPSASRLASAGLSTPPAAVEFQGGFARPPSPRQRPVDQQNTTPGHIFRRGGAVQSARSPGSPRL